MTIKGTGRALAPGVIIIYWKSLNAPERMVFIIFSSQFNVNKEILITGDVHLVYSILGTDNRTFVVGYYCNEKNKKGI